MKTSIILALLVGVAVAISDKDLLAFQPGKEFTFQLNSQALTGIPHLSAQFSGFKINAQTSLQIYQRYRAALQCDNIKFYTLNAVLNNLPTDNIVPDSQWQELEPEQQELYENCLREPVKFRYEQGIVSDLEVAQDEPEWCTNLKKGVLSLFQLDISRQQQIQDVEPKYAHLIQQNKMSWDQSFDKTYRSMEETIDGDCESLYVVREVSQGPVNLGEKMFKVSKTRNYDNCHIRPAYEEGMLSSYVADAQNRRNQTGLRSFSNTNATIQGQRNGFVISALKQVSRQLYTPLSEEDGEVASFSVQELNLKMIRDIVSVIQTPEKTRRCPEGLKITLQKNEASQLKQPSNSEVNEERTNVIDELLTKYVTECTPAVTEAAMETVRKLMFALRDCSSEDISTVLRKLRENLGESRAMEESIDAKKLKTLIDLIPTVGRPQILPVVEQMIRDQYVSPMQAAAIFNYIALTIKPTVEVVESLLPSSEMFNLSAVKSSSQLRQAILLALGTTQHGLTMAQKTEPISQKDYESITYSFKNELKELYRASVLDEDRITVLKTIGNSGLPNCISFLEELLQDDQTPMAIRLNAVLALHRMPNAFSQQIQSILLTIYTNPMNAYGLRSMAYLGTMKSNPSYVVVQAVVDNLKSERSQEVGAFVYSHLKDIADSSRLSLKETRRHVRLTMKQAKPIISKKFYTNTYSLDVMAEDLGLGQYFDFYMLDSPRTVFPNGFAGVWGQTVNGREVNVLEGGIHFKGVEEILNRLMGPKSFLRDLVADDEQLSTDIIDIVKDLLRPHKSPNMGKVDELVRNVIAKLGLSERDAEHFNSGAYLKVLGNELRFWMLNSHDIISWIDENKREAYEWVITIMQKLQTGYRLNMMQTMATESVVMIPSAMGIPLYINESYCHVVRLTGNTKLSGNLFQSNGGEGIKFDANLFPSFAVEIRGSMGMKLPLTRAGVSVKTSMAMKDQSSMNINLQQESKMLTFRYNIPNQPTEVVKFEAVPTTYIHKIDSEPTTDVYTCQEKEIKNPKLVKHVSITIPYDCEIFGVKVEHRMEFPKSIVSFTPVRPFNGKHTYIWERKSSAAANQYIEMQLQLASTPDKYSSGEKYGQSSQQKQVNYRSGSRRAEFQEDFASEEFQSVLQDSSLSMPKKNMLRVSVVTKNTPEELHLNSMITLLKDSDYKYQLNVQASEQSMGWKVYFNTVTDLRQIINPTKSVDQKPEKVANMEVRWSIEGEGDYFTSMTINTGDKEAKVEVPVEPLYVYKLRTFFNMRDIDINYQPQQESRSSSWLFEGNSQEVYNDGMEQDYARGMLPLSEIRKYAYKYTIDVNYEQVPQQMQQYVQQYLQYIYYTMQQDMAMIPKKEKSSPGHLNVIARFMPSMEKLHLFFDTAEYETSMYCTARLPTYLKRALTLDSNLILMNQKYMDKNQEAHGIYGNKQAKCTVETDSETRQTIVTTFDDVSYDLPELSEDCEIVVAKDCTPSRLFTVLLSNTDGKKQLNILLPRTQIQVRVSSGWSSNAEVLIDGQQAYLQEGESKAVTIDINDRPVRVAQLTQRDNTIYIELERLGLSLSCNEQSISVNSHPLHSGQVCGICGDYNGDELRELTGARQVLHSEAKQFALSYVVPSARCDVAELRRQHNTNQQTDDACQPQKYTKVVRNVDYDSDESEQTCLSIEPLYKCPRHCEPVEERTERVAFHCLPRSSPYTRRLVQDSQQRPLYELASKNRDRFIEVSIPEKCQPIY